MKSGSVTFPMLLILALAGTAVGHRILILPHATHFNSHLFEVREIVDILHEAGHDVTMLITTHAVEYNISEHASLATYDVPEDVRRQMDGLYTGSNLKPFTPTEIYTYLELSIQFCDALLGHTKLLNELKAADFDLVFVDIEDDCGRITLDYLGAPSIVYSSCGFSREIGVFYPQISSFVYQIESSDGTGHITFMDRTINLLRMGFMNYAVLPVLFRKYNRLREKHQINTSDVSTTFSRYVVLAQSDFVLDYPRPMMPNVFPISGLFREQPRSLGSELMRFMEDSDPHGVVVLSLGSGGSHFETQQAEVIASVFGRLKQRVIWRNMGTRPKSLANNTMLTGWFPQNDVLAHPLTKVFITHCGMKSMYEAAYNAVPVIAVPLAWDQHYNAVKLVHRVKMGVMLDFNTFQEYDLESALYEVLHNPSYLENAKATSALLSDQPIPPKQQLLNLFDYVIRHRGAQHLVSDAALSLNTFQFYSIDVLCALLCALCVTVATSVLTIRTLWRYCCGRATPSEKLD